MSGIISYTALGGKSGVMGRIPSFKVTGADGTHNWEQAGRTWHASTVAWDTAGGVTRSRSSGEVQGSFTATTYTAPVTGLYQMNFNMNAGNNSNNTETRYASSYMRKNADGASCGLDHLQSMENITDGWGAGNSYQAHARGGLVKLIAGDYCYLWFNRSSSSDYNGSIYAGAAWWFGHLVEAYN